MVTAQSLRQQFPEFGNPDIYNDAAIGLWLTVAKSLLSPNAWAELLDYATALFVCHHLVLGAKEQRAAKFGIPGAVTGVNTQKAVDKVSASYDASAVTLTDGDFWNMSEYGIRFLSMARLMGAGGVQL